MADIFDEVLAERKSVPKKDIFDEVLSERQIKGGVKQNENAESKSDQGTRSQGDAQRTLDGKVNATNAPGSEGGGELRPLDEGQSQRIYEARVSTDSVKGGENNAKQENAQAEAGYGPEVRKEDGQGVRSQEDARNKEEVKNAGGVQPSTTSKIIGAITAPMGYLSESTIGAISGIQKALGMDKQAEESALMASTAVEDWASTFGGTPVRGGAGETAAKIGAGILELPALALTGTAGIAGMLAQGFGGTKKDLYEKYKQEGLTDKEANKKSSTHAAITTAAALPAYYLGGRIAGKAADAFISESAPKLLNAAGRLGMNAVANGVASAAVRGFAAGIEGEDPIKAAKDVSLEGSIQDVLFAAHSTAEHFKAKAAEGKAQEAATEVSDAMLDVLAKKPEYADIANEEIQRRAKLKVSQEAETTDLPITASAVQQGNILPEVAKFEEAPSRPITLEPVKEAPVEEPKKDIEQGAPPLSTDNTYFENNLAQRAWRIAAGFKWDSQKGDWVHPDYPESSRAIAESEVTPPSKQSVDNAISQLKEKYGVLEGKKPEEVSPSFSEGDFVKVPNIVPTYSEGKMVGSRTEMIAGKVARTMPDGSVEVRLQQGGYKTIKPSDIQPIKPAEAPAEAQPTKPSETEIQKTSGLPTLQRKPSVGEAEVKAEGGVAQGKREGEEEVAPLAAESAKPSNLQELENKYTEAKNKTESLGKEPRKPSNEIRAFGSKGRAGADPSDVARYDAEVKAYNSWKRKYLKYKKEEVNAGNEWFYAKQKAERTTITPSEDVVLGKNDAGETIYQRKNGEVYRMRFDRKNKPQGYPDFGGDLAVVEEPPKPEVTIPKGARVAAAAYLAPDGNTYEGSSHLDAMQKAKKAGAITQAEIDAKQSPESRNTEEFGYAVTLPDGTRTTTTREAGGKIAKASGQALKEEFDFGDKMHSNETEKDEYDENGKRRVPPYLLYQNPTEYARQGLQLGLEEEVKDPIYKKEIADAIADPSKKLSNEGRLQFDKILRRLNLTRDDMQGMGIVPPGTKETIFLIDQTKDSFSKLSDIIMDKKLPNAYKAGVLPEMYQHAGAHIAVPSIADNFYSKIFQETYKSDPDHINRVGDFLNKDQIVGGYENFKKSLDIINDRLESETDSKVKNKLSREKKETEQAIADIEEVHDIPALKSELTETIKDDAVARDVKRVIDILNPWMDQMYNEGKNVDTNTPREGRGWISGARINLLTKADAEKLTAYGDPEKPAPQPSINSTSNVKIRRDRFARKALFTGDYTSNMYDIITNSVGARWNNVTKLRLFNALIDKGVAVLDEPGKPRPEEIGGEGVAKIETPWPETNPETGITTMKNKVLWVQKSLYPELDRALDSSLKPSKIGILTPLTKIQTYGLGDFTAHGTNLLAKTLVAAVKKPPRGDTSLSKIPLIGRATEAFKDLMDLSYQYHKNTPEIREKIKELAELGVVRAEYGSEKPTVFGIKLTTTHKILHDIDTVARLYAAKAYDELAEQGYTNYNKADKIRFIAALGEYNRRLMGQKSAFLRDTGISPFIVAGRAMNAAAIETIAPLSTPYKASNFKTRIKANAGIVGAAAAATIFPAIVNMFTTGSLTGRYGTPLGVIDFGPSFDTEDGKRRSIDLYKPLFIRRGLRATGLNAVINGLMTGESPEDIQNHAANEMATTWSHPFVGPGIGFLTMIATGKRIDLRSGYATRIEPRKMKGALMQKIENLRIGLKELSPLGYELLKRPVIQPVMEKGLGVERPGEEIVQDIKAKEKGGGAGSQALATGKDIAVSALKQLGSGILGYKESTSPAERLASELGEGVQFTAKEDARFAYRREYINMVKRGEKNQADLLLSQAVNDGIMEKADFKSLKRSLKNTDKIVAKVGMLKTPDAAIRVFRVASPQEQDLIYNEIAKKIQGSSTLNQEEKQKQINDLVSFSKKGTIVRHYLDKQMATPK